MNRGTARYPLLEIDLDKLKANLAALIERCQSLSVEVTGGVKGFSALPEAAGVYTECGVRSLASSRLSQLRALRGAGVACERILIRIPMLSELPEVAEVADMSLQSELETLRALNAVCAKRGTRHRVILMADLGDLREGFWSREELVDAALEVEYKLDHLELAGVGTNLGCYGSVAATPEKLRELVSAAEAVEQAQSSGASQGVLRELRLRFLVERRPDGELRIAFADLGWETASLRNLSLLSLLVWALAMVGLFFVSLVLSSVALRPAERAWQQQRQFVADASHELKTPLTVITANTELLLSHPEDTVAAQSKWLEYTHDEAEQMKELVDDLLFLAKSDAARQPAARAETAMNEVALDCLLPSSRWPLRLAWRWSTGSPPACPCAETRGNSAGW